MKNYFLFFSAAVFEIAGCYAFWLWLRLDRNVLWILPGIISLVFFALVLTRVESSLAGRAYAAYGGIYIVSSLAWLSWVEQVSPAISDYVGALICLIGATIILLGPRL